MNFFPLGDSAVTIEFDGRIGAPTLAAVRRAMRLIERQPPIGIVELVPAYTSLTVYYDSRRFDYATVEEELRRRLAEPTVDVEVTTRLLVIPVCYAPDFAPDLEEVARHTGLPVPEIIARHAASEYTVHMLGFVPGFPYLGGLPEELATPRRPTPRRSVPAGSVGIAGTQTGIYPIETPGGWQLVGRTPWRLFDPLREPPCLLQLGDRVRFRPIEMEEFLTWERSSAEV